MKSHFPHRDYAFQIQKMVGWWNEAGRVIKRPFSAFTNWLEKTRPDVGLVEKEHQDRKQKEFEQMSREADKMKASPESAKKKLAEIRQTLTKKMTI